MSDEFKVQWSVSLPPSAQYAKGHMLNLRGSSVDEVEDQFDEVLSGKFIDKATEVAALLVAAQVVTDTFKGGNESTGAAQSQPAQQSSSPDPIYTCDHGKRTRREGYGKKGKWVGHFCPLAKGDPNQCDPVWEDN